MNEDLVFEDDALHTNFSRDLITILILPNSRRHLIYHQNHQNLKKILSTFFFRSLKIGLPNLCL